MMSLSLIQDYSSAGEEKEEEDDEQIHYQSSSDDEANASAAAKRTVRYDLPRNSVDSGLPSAFDVFSQISGPPRFLNNSLEVKASSIDVDSQQSRRRNRKNKKELPAGAVMEAKAQLVGIHDRVRSDMEGDQPPASVSSTTRGVKRVATATNPNAEDAAELLRMCLQCGIPKTFSNTRGMVCPVCSDCPPADISNESKKKGSIIKDREKSKRMKGQSSHATWKSETEMQLRQQFD
ncbi:hypothetical protein WN944_026886 [Citrus x changshan-huyou]|uniref:Uncharacterized protein n=1 Tax=Citrus x changshan-huyou TaxID=2935761 RepID=A0AAP0LIW7_9ROSI